MNILSGHCSALLRASKRWRLPAGMLFSLFLLYTPYTSAQRLSLKTNVLEWGMLSPNIGAEFLLNDNLTLELTASGSPFRLKDDLYLKHFRLQPELKYWFLTLMTGHYMGFTAFYSNYDAAFGGNAYYGEAYAAGFTYGYHWVLSRRWNLELSAGVGMLHYRQAKYLPGTEHPEPDETGWTPAPVKVGISFVYILK